MLNIIKSKLKNSYNDLTFNVKQEVKVKKYIVSIVRNWKNSIYAFNNKNLNNIYEANKLINKLIYSYFNLYNLKIESLIRKSRSFSKNKKKRSISKNRILISLGQFKHTNDLINITVYIFNKQIETLNKLLYKDYMNIIIKNKNLFYNKIEFVNSSILKLLNRESKIKFLLLKVLKDKNKINNIESNIYNIYLKKSMEKELKCIYINILRYINNSKFNNYYLHNLNNLIRKIYNKKIEFNFINLKYFYFNSDIYTQVLLLKLSVVKRKLQRSLKKSIKKVKIQSISYINNSKYLKNFVLDKVNNKKIAGVKLEVSGRLTKRFTASRSLFKLKLKGKLNRFKSRNYLDKNNKVSLGLVRGNIRSNLDYTRLNSITRIGSYGIKGWIASE
uniref:ribosomal protein S5 n=1 Tax=Onygena corvina TaxID=180788 RepID=UPI0028D403B9|nr:ribosomal protein S5 [Onygena corvina]WML69475.1 ribosomal protein S5 [Onygena corvina]